MKYISALATAVILTATTPAFAQSTIRSLPPGNQLLEAYIAQISYHDLYNSAGAPLSNPWQVLRQDRANFHRFGRRDVLDQSDGFFADAGNRAIMENMLSQGSITGQAARDIMSGKAVVLVEIHGYGTVGRELHVTVAR